MWTQHQLQLPPFRRGFHIITREVAEALPELAECRVGLLHIHLLHTSASLTLNESAAPAVRDDLETVFTDIAPDGDPRHTHDDEGPDDMPAHVKHSLLGASLTLPVSNGRLVLGTWQGIQLAEHRDHAGPRRLVLTLHGE